jgi:hypothetical protein
MEIRFIKKNTMGGMGGVVVIRLPLIAVVPMAGFDPRLRYFM